LSLRPAKGGRHPEGAKANPFDRFDLDPRAGVAAITARLRELAEAAQDDAARERIRAAWEELTLHPARRLRAALFAHPETRLPLGAPPPLGRRRPPAADSPLLSRLASLAFRDLAPRPSLLAAVLARVTGAAPAYTKPSLEDDPVLDDEP
jgi:hypothetical protein